MSTSPSKPFQWLLFVLLSLAWGSSFLFIKIGVSHVGPMTLVAGRFFIGWVAISFLLVRNKVDLPASKIEWGHLIFLGFVNTALPIFLISWGEQNIDSGMAAVLNGTVPIWTVLLAHLMLHDEPLSARRLAGIFIGFIGVVVLVGLPDRLTGNNMIMGQLAVIGAALSYAFSAVYIRRYVHGIPYLRTIWVTLLTAMLITITAATVTEHPVLLALHPNAVIAMLWLGLVGTAFAYQLYYRLLAWWGAGRATSVTYTFPVIGLLLGVIFLGERLTLQTVAGSLLVLLGVMQTHRS